jgi:pyruvate dehydrogenase E1 component
MEHPMSWTDTDLRTLERIQARVLWLSTYMIHHANHVRPNADGLKVGGHQASSASVVGIMTALYGMFLRPADRIAVKPHASPVFHALQYLRGRLPREALARFRMFGGLQAYPSRTKDVDGVDFSTGSVGLGAVAATFGGLVRQYLMDHFDAPSGARYIALVGDAELDEGNIWEAVAEEYTRRLNNVVWIVDLNRQSLDRVIPDGKAQRIREMFTTNGWHVINLKYGSRLKKAFARPHGERLRRRIDDMPNAEYQALLRMPGADIRKRLVAPPGTRPDHLLDGLLGSYGDDEVRELLANLGGHDLGSLLEAFEEAEAHPDSPVVIVAYTIKGWGLPFEGDPLNHSMLLTQAQIDALREAAGIRPGDEWADFEPGSPEWRLLHRDEPERGAGREIPAPPPALDESYASRLSTQEAFSRVLSALSRQPIADFLVTASPDVATSTHLGGWINRRGVYSQQAMIDYFAAEKVVRPIQWRESPKGQHIELGISENNLFLLLAALGLAGDQEGQRLIPLGTLYDPFVCRGLDAFIYGVYSGSRFILVATPSGVSLAPEGGAHQSSITASIGIEIPGVDYFEPTFARELEWILLDALDTLRHPGPGLGVYLRLSTVPIDQRLFPEGREELRAQVLSGGYRLVDRRAEPGYEPEENVVNIFAMGAIVPEAIAASERLRARGTLANVFVVTAPGRLYRSLSSARRAHQQGAAGPAEAPRHDGPAAPAASAADARPAHRIDVSTRTASPTDLAPRTPGAQHSSALEGLLEPRERRAPVVTVADAHSHALAFIGSALGGRTIALGVDRFGESGSRGDLYRKMRIDAQAIADAAEAALLELDSYA